MKTVIYFLRNDAPLYMDTYFLDKALKAFLMKNMYRHYKVNRMSSKARRVVTDLFNLYLTEPECLPTEWQLEMQTRTASERARRVADFIAGNIEIFLALYSIRKYQIRHAGFTKNDPMLPYCLSQSMIEI